MLRQSHLWLCGCLLVTTVAAGNSEQPKRARAHGVIQDEVDDYHEFDAETVRNRASPELRQVTFKPYAQKYDIPSVDAEEAASGVAKMMPKDGSTVSTLSPVPQQNRALAKQTTIYAPQQQYLRKGYYYMHYPWDRLPRQYLLRPYYQYAYPPAHQNAVYAYRQPLPYTDPYGIYRNHPGNLSPCGSYGASGASGCGQALGCGGGQGCGGSGRGGCRGRKRQRHSPGYTADCGDQSFEEDSAEFEDDDETSGGKSGEAQLNKKDPLDDLDLEDLEKLEKAKDSSEGKRRTH